MHIFEVSRVHRVLLCFWFPHLIGFHTLLGVKRRSVGRCKLRLRFSGKEGGKAEVGSRKKEAAEAGATSFGRAGTLRGSKAGARSVLTDFRVSLGRVQENQMHCDIV